MPANTTRSSPRSRRETKARLRLAALALAGAAAPALAASAAPPPAPSAPISRNPATLAQALRRTATDLRVAIDRWNDLLRPPPEDVTLLTLYEQRIYRLLVREPQLERATLARLSQGLAAVGRDYVAAQRELRRLT